MTRFFLILACIVTLLLFCQWFVFVSMRAYLFGRYDRPSRVFRLTVILLLATANALLLVLNFSPDFLYPGSSARKFLAVAYFGSLGWILFMGLFFTLLEAACRSVDLGRRLLGTSASVVRDSEIFLSDEKGCVTACSGRPASAAALSNSASSPAVDNAKPFSSTPVPDRDRRKAHAESSSDAGSSHGQPSPTRRTFLRWTAAAGIAGVTAYAARGTMQGYGTPTFETFDMHHPALKAMDGTLTIIQITDFHFGLFFGQEELGSLVRLLNGIEADLLVFTGDTFHSPLSPVESAAPLLRGLRERRLGTIAVLGNHDFYSGERRSVETLQAAGITLLRNRLITFRQGEALIHLGGIDDPLSSWLSGTDFPKFPAFARAMPDGPGLRILLSHRPSVLPLAARAGIDLVLAGHTHGGQIVLPVPGATRGVSIARLASPFTHGWYRVEETRMYLNRGVGLTFIPWRLNCPPEVAVIRLKASADNRVSVRRADPVIPRFARDASEAGRTQGNGV